MLKKYIIIPYCGFRGLELANNSTLMTKFLIHILRVHILGII